LARVVFGSRSTVRRRRVKQAGQHGGCGNIPETAASRASTRLATSTYTTGRSINSSPNGPAAHRRRGGFKYAATLYVARRGPCWARAVEGLNCFAEAAQIIEATGERHNVAELYRLRGDLLYATGNPSAAEESYHQALAVAKRQSAKLWELPGATSPPLARSRQAR
jgi:tetratricopeptide (TPR) repeat protein